MAIVEFPTEILCKIFLEIPTFTDLLACRLVCRNFYQVFKGFVRLEYQIELEKAGMINNSACKLPTPARLKMLRERERAWTSLNWKSFTPDIGVPSPASPLHEITSNMTVLGLLDTDIYWAGAKMRGFQSVELPLMGDTVSAEWKSADVGEDILNFGVAIEDHDLLAYVTK